MNIFRNILSIGVLWGLIISTSFFWNYFKAVEEREEIAFSTAEMFFQQIVITRQWNANHGGVYVPVTEETQPN